MENDDLDKIKIELIQWITTIDDTEILDELSQIRNHYNPYQLSEEEKLALQKGVEDFEVGRIVSHEEVRKIYEKWL